MPTRLQLKLIIWASRIHALVLRISNGRLMGRIKGLNILLLSTKGRHNGLFHKNPLLYIHCRGEYYCAASFAGSDNNPDWYFNILADPTVELLVRGNRFTAVAVRVVGCERERIWGKLVDSYPAFAKYQKRTERIIPVIRFIPLYVDDMMKKRT